MNIINAHLELRMTNNKILPQNNAALHKVSDNTSSIVIWSFRELLALALCLIPGIAFLFSFLWRSGQTIDGIRQYTLFDDAMISMTYARTLAETGEWVWYAGADRVQGFTNPLWTAYMAALHKIGLTDSGIAFSVSLTGIILILASAIIAGVLVRQALPGSRYSIFAMAASTGTVPFLYPLTFWTLRGMEVGLLAFFALSMAVFTIKASNHIDKGLPYQRCLIFCGLLAILGILTRLDFAAIAFILIFWCLFWAPNKESRIDIMRLVAIPMVLFIIAILIFQSFYWGDWLPNTYRLKVEGFSVTQRLARGFTELSKALPFIIVVALSLFYVQRNGSLVSRRVVATSASTFFIACVYSAWVGGDAWEWSGVLNRYVAVALPSGTVAVFIGLGVFLEQYYKNTSRNSLAITDPASILMSSFVSLIFVISMIPTGGIKLAMILALLIFLLMLIFYLSINHISKNLILWSFVALLSMSLFILSLTSAIPSIGWLRGGGLHVSDDHAMAVRGRALAGVTKSDAVIATVWAGAPAYYSRRPMVDLLGKSDWEIAGKSPKGDLYPGHNKWDYSYSIGKLRPDVVFQLWRPEEIDLKKLLDWGYLRLCNESIGSAYYLSSSHSINWPKLKECS